MAYFLLVMPTAAVFLVLFIAAEARRANPVERRALSDRRLRLGRRLEIYIEPRDVWIGTFIGEFAVYIAPLPCVVIRWDRSKGGDGHA